ncbi:hypothetical protein D1839_20035 [Roseburia sp. 1XD42-34]|nr:hypothetical protein [Roseburia sp. 1XD42-34]RKI73776.1 hypothetical protein D7V87_20000 [Clostridium sp. 1xD42-85]
MCLLRVSETIKKVQNDRQYEPKRKLLRQCLIESFHGILKRELVYQTNYKTREEARKSLFKYIEFFYNSKRIHSTLGYYTPNEFEQMYGNSAA